MGTRISGREHLVDADSEDFLNVWPSKSISKNPPGAAWQQRLPYTDPSSPAGRPATIITDSARLDSSEYTRGFGIVYANKRVIHVEGQTGFGIPRLRAQAGGKDFGPISDRWYCRDSGCVCPKGWTLKGELPEPLHGKPLYVALTAGHRSASAGISIITLEKWQKLFCRKQGPPKVISGTVTGSSTSPDFAGTLTYTGTVEYTYRSGAPGVYGYDMTAANISWSVDWTVIGEFVTALEKGCHITGSGTVKFDAQRDRQGSNFSMFQDTATGQWKYWSDFTPGGSTAIHDIAVATAQCPPNPDPTGPGPYDLTSIGNMSVWHYPTGGDFDGSTRQLSGTPQTLSGSQTDTHTFTGLTTSRTWNLTGSGVAGT